MMSFLSTVFTSRYPTTKNQLQNSSNPRQQATINDGRITLQPVQGRQISFASGTSKTYTPGASGNAIAEVYNPDNVDTNMINQAIQAMSSSEQLNFVNHLETEITSNSNIIPYSQYVIESQQAAVQNSKSPAQPDALILYTRFKQARAINNLRSYNKLHKWYQSHEARDLSSTRVWACIGEETSSKFVDFEDECIRWYTAGDEI
nr:hypothetical protein [Tanacetum cinerariifolium]